MTSVETTGTRLRGAVLAAMGAVRSGRSWRATLHAVAGLPVGLAAFGAVAGLVVIWAAAIWSLFDPDGNRLLLAIWYVLLALAIPFALLWSVRAFAALQRARFAALLGAEVAAPPRAEGRWLRWLGRGWRAPATWRQLGYHLLALVIGGVGGALVALCWSAVPVALAYPAVTDGGWRPGAAGMTLLALALLLAAPWVARGVARLDAAAARALLGPSRAEQLARRVESLARSRADIIAATDAERRRIERDLHDGAQQRLVSLAMNLGMARANLVDAPEPARRAIEQAHDEATQALAELREFVRGLHPAVLDDRGLDAALSGIVARAPLPVRLGVDVSRRCSPAIEAVAYFVVSEALTNVAKHAGASQAEVSVVRTGDRLRIVVGDDGRGGATLGGGGTGGPDGGAGSGLRGLAQRAAAVDGTFAVDSPPGGPTAIIVELPCES